MGQASEENPNQVKNSVTEVASPPPPPLTPSTTVVSPVLSIQSSGEKLIDALMVYILFTFTVVLHIIIIIIFSVQVGSVHWFLISFNFVWSSNHSRGCCSWCGRRERERLFFFFLVVFGFRN